MNSYAVSAHPDFDDHEVVEIIDSEDLKAIIAVHNSNLGPATGGCRMFPYASMNDALTDVLRLSRGMTYKSALAGLPLGGDPSPRTAQGVFLGIREAVDFRYSTNLSGMHVAVQGAGHVGLHLVQMLLEAGARVTAADVNESNVAAARELGAQIVSPDEITGVDAQVFAPCAMGGAINESSLRDLRASIIAGAANNQLACVELDEVLQVRGILYAPDYVINAGGIIDVYYQRAGERSESVIEVHISRIVRTLRDIFAEADKTGRGTGAVADSMAEAVFTKGYRAVA